MAPNEPGSSKSGLSGLMTPPGSRSSTPVPGRVPKRKPLSAETEETKSLSTPELQRLVLLEQLRYTRAKMRRLEQQDHQTTDQTPNLPVTVSLTNLDSWEDHFM